jgi:hypothetical protein
LAPASALREQRATDFRALDAGAIDRRRNYADVSIRMLEETYQIG